jgi:hypothetical protein
VRSTRSVLRGAAALVLTALLVGPSAHAGTSAPAVAPATMVTHVSPAVGHPTNEGLMMGPHCGADAN